MFLSFIKIKQCVIPIEKENAIHYLPVDTIKKSINLSEPRLRNMVVLSCTIHCVVLALFFFIQGQQNRLSLNPLAHSTLVSVVNLTDLLGSGDNQAISLPTPETKKEGVPKIPPLSMPLQKKSTVKQIKTPAVTPKKLAILSPPQENAVSPPFDPVNVAEGEYQPVCLATPSLPNFRNYSDSPRGYEKSENLATDDREAFSRNNESGSGLGSGENSRGSRGGDAGNSYLMMVRSKIEQHKIYPRQASLRQIQGTVIIHFIITLEGIVKGVDLVQSSGFTVLDQAGLKAVKDASPFPKPPVEFFQTAVSIEVPILFELI